MKLVLSKEVFIKELTLKMCPPDEIPLWTWGSACQQALLWGHSWTWISKRTAEAMQCRANVERALRMINYCLSSFCSLKFYLSFCALREFILPHGTFMPTHSYADSCFLWLCVHIASCSASHNTHMCESIVS